jgi:hypothetical protein
MTCPRCGLELPDHARFCARCGARQAAPKRTVEAWVLIVFSLGVVVTALVATLYSAIALYPSAASTNLDPATVRTGSLALAAGLGILCVLQSVALGGLVRGRDWGRAAATATCVLWSLTCIGLPLSILVLLSIWGSRSAARSPRTLDSRG